MFKIADNTQCETVGVDGVECGTWYLTPMGHLYTRDELSQLMTITNDGRITPVNTTMMGIDFTPVSLEIIATNLASEG